MDEDKIIPYIEPIYLFCRKRLSDNYDAEDLASEIICHVLEGMKKYKIESLDGWVWRVAHNRYARFIDAKNKSSVTYSGDIEFFDSLEGDFTAEEDTAGQEYEAVFRTLHTLSAEYRGIFVDYYIGGLPVKALAQKYSLPETTVKWRLNSGREKIRNRIGENSMTKVYSRINWNTTSCRGSMNPDKYLHTQVSRAICASAYEKPLTVEEISLATGIPAMYIEDELPRLEYGDAVCRVGKNKYAANFIILSLEDKKHLEKASADLVKKITDKFEAMFTEKAEEVRGLDFYGSGFGMERLGYFTVPHILKDVIKRVKEERLNLPDGPYPVRKDGGYGWFLVDEIPDESDPAPEYNPGCNIVGKDKEIGGKIRANIYYYWYGKYFEKGITRGINWLCSNDIPTRFPGGTVGREVIPDEDAVKLLENNLVTRTNDGYRLSFPCFTEGQLEEYMSLFKINDGSLDDLLAEYITTVRRNFEKLVPARLEEQINARMYTYLFGMAANVIEELVRRGIMRKPDGETPLTDGVFYAEE